MLAPFVLDLLIGCTLLLMAGWANQFLARGKHVNCVSRAAVRPLRPERQTFDREVFFVCSPRAADGEWLFTLEDLERN